MIVKSPLKKQNARPNLRKVPDTDSSSGNIRNMGNRRKQNEPGKKIKVPKFKPWKVILGSFLIGLFGFIYLTNVFQTQTLLEEVQQMEAEYNKIRSQYDELKLNYNKMVGPAEIYRKAKNEGFIDGGPADQVITVRE